MVRLAYINFSVLNNNNTASLNPSTWSCKNRLLVVINNIIIQFWVFNLDNGKMSSRAMRIIMKYNMTYIENRQ